MTSACRVLACTLLLGAPALAQEPQPAPIEDNSFFIEEAYNQERGVVQHISTLVHFHSPLRRSDYGFTQEWPLRSQRHQLSYTVPYAWPGESASGIGDLALNYRYQLLGHDAWAAVAPRVSLIVPTGHAGLGAGASGVQLNLPASRRIGRSLVAHLNAGASFFPATGERSTNLGASLIGLVTPRFNVMLEAVGSRGRERDAGGAFAPTRETIVSPGVRYAINRGSLQIVPGLGLPIRFGEGRVRLGAFLYLSFEHPFARASR